MLSQVSVYQIGALAPERVGGVYVGGGFHVPGNALHHPTKVSIGPDLFERQTSRLEVVTNHHDPSQDGVSLVLLVIHA